MPDHEESQKHPSSPNRIAASRANGALSHGPSTPEGKLKCAEASAKANIKHGMLADTVVLNGESRDRFIALLESFIAEHGPITQSEQACVHKMAVAYWRQMRTWSFQSLDFNREMARQDASFPAPFRATLAFRILCSDDSNSLSTSHRYETMYDRQFNRALREFDALKAKRDPTLGLPAAPACVAASTWQVDGEP